MKSVNTIRILTPFYIKQLWKELPFIIIVSCGLGLLVAFTLLIRGAYESPAMPSTYEVLSIVRRFQPGILLLMTLYTGELFSREAQVRISPLLDVLPNPEGTRLVSQILAMVGILASVLCLMMLTGIFTQMGLGFYDLDIGQYLLTLFTETFFNGIFIIVLTLFIHVLVNHKFLGHALCIVFILIQNYLPVWGLEHNLFRYARMSLGIYSDLTGYPSNTLTAFLYYSFYWSGLALILIQLSRLMLIRGIETGMKNRLKLATSRFHGKALVYTTIGLTTFIISGFMIYTKTVLSNDFESRKALELSKYEYEIELKQFAEIVSPEIVSVKIKADLYPEQNRYELTGQYVLINSSDKPLKQIHVQRTFDSRVSTKAIDFDQIYIKKTDFEHFGYTIYELNTPLDAGDSLLMDFELKYGLQGFDQRQRQYLTQTASFFTESHLPRFGYHTNYELDAAPLRKTLGLPVKERLPEIDKTDVYNMGLNNANNVAFEAILSTKEGYHATTSGELIKEWKENDRAYFHYKSENDIENQYMIITGKLVEHREYMVHGKDSINISIFHYPTHAQNLSHIKHAMRVSMHTYQQKFSPYQYHSMTLMEVPRVHDFAMSVPNTVAISEVMGFMTNNNGEGLNVPFYITAHEVAHQWWGDQVRGAVVKGEDMITETLAQYAAGLVTIQEFGEESMNHMLRYERGRYLQGRKREVQQEQPLFKAENQSYIHYGKGLISMMALRHYISEDSVNSALRRVIDTYPANQGVYTNTLDIIREFRKSSPDSLQYLITDLFERIIFFENRINNASTSITGTDQYNLNLKLQTKKFESDELGTLQPVAINDWIEIAVYGLDKQDKEVLLHRQMHYFDKETSSITLTLNGSPTRVQIDPAEVLMDRNLEDNVWWF